MNSGDDNNTGTTYSLFHERSGDRVKFYSDSYDNEQHDAGAFSDMINCMRGASDKICITGWTLSPTVSFDYADTTTKRVSSITLPELFVECAAKKVKVNALIWKNITPDFKGDTEAFQKYIESAAEKMAKKICDSDNSLTAQGQDALNKAYKEKKKELLDFIQIKFSDTQLGYSDHAKLVIVDNRDLFMGGLDLTVGRSDTRTWHDCHCHIQKPHDGKNNSSAVDDAQELFDNRFNVQATKKRNAKISRKLSKFASTSLLPLESELFRSIKYSMSKKTILYDNHDLIIDVLKSKQKKKEATANPPTNPPPPSTINQSEKSMRLLTAVRKENFDPDGKMKPKFKWSKDTHTREILISQVESILAAKKFIYMESQFFTGPHKDKKTNETIEGPNLVIVALLDKIKEKIKNGEDFHFYCQLPFRPEGKANDPVVQVILRKQWNTMEWFLSEVNDAMKAYNQNHEVKRSVSDYITFTNLGFRDPNKEKEDGYEMKYTHSKLMIIDDDVAFIGSNNCNERSNKGNRDHEVCMRMQNYPEIKDFRRQLMAQQLGMSKEDFIKMELKHGEPQTRGFIENVHIKIDDNLLNLHTTNNPQPVATPWGNTSREALEQGVKPPHVIAQTPTSVSAVQNTVPLTHKFPR